MGYAHVAFSPSGDLLAATAEPGVVKLHNLATGGELNLCALQPASIHDLSFSHDGTLVTVAALDGTNIGVFVLDARNGSIVSSYSVKNPSRSAHFGNALLSADNLRLYFSLADNMRSLQCVRLSDGKVLWEHRSQNYNFTGMAVSPDDRFLATGTGYEFSSIQVWNAQTGEPATKLEGHTSWIGQLSFSRDGRYLASAAGDQTIRVWTTETWEQAAVFRGHGDEAQAVAWSADGEYLASGSRDGEVMLWEFRGKKRFGERQALPARVVDAHALPGGDSVLALDTNQIWSVIHLANLQETPVSGPTQGVSVFRPPRYLGTHDRTNTFRLYEAANRGLKLLIELPVSASSNANPANFAYSPAKRLLAWRETIRIIRIASLDEPAKQTVISNEIALIPIAFGGSGRFLLATTPRAGLATLTAVVWDLSSLKEIVRTTFAAGQRQTTLLANEGTTLVTHEAGGSLIELRNLLAPERQPASFQQPGVWNDAAFSFDGRYVALGSWRATAGVYDVIKQERVAILHGQLAAAGAVAFSPDGTRLISTSIAEEMVKLWDLTTQQEFLTLAGNEANHGTE